MDQPWPQDKLGRLRVIVERKECNEIDGVLVDMFSASVILKVHDALNEENRARFISLRIEDMVDIALSLL